MDPTGLGFWKSIKKFFSNWGGLFGMTGGLINGIINDDWSMLRYQATSLATAFVFSGGNPYATLASFMATSILDTPPGKQAVNWVSGEIFDDAFGMSPRTAYIFGNMVTNAILSSAIYIAITPTTYTGPDYRDPVNKAEIKKYPQGVDKPGNGGSGANQMRVKGGRVDYYLFPSEFIS